MAAPNNKASDRVAPPRGRALLRALPLLLLLAGLIPVFASGAHRYLTLESIAAHRDWLQTYVDQNQARALGAYLGVYVAVVSLSIPGAALLTICGGFLFGWLLGSAMAAISSTLGAIVIFSIARTSVGDFLLRLAGPRLQALSKGFREDAFSYLLFLRVLPVFPFWLTNLAAALFGVRLRTFALATQIGVVPMALAFATAGAGFDSVLVAQQRVQAHGGAAGRLDCDLDIDIGALVTPQLLAALAALGLLSLVPVLLRRFSSRASGLDAR